MRKYELMYIIRPNLEEEGVKAVIERFQGIATDNGAEIENLKEMGKKRLAYEIDKFREGFYVLMNIVANSEAVSELERLLKINEDVIRYIIVKEEE